MSKKYWPKWFPWPRQKVWDRANGLLYLKAPPNDEYLRETGQMMLNLMDALAEQHKRSVELVRRARNQQKVKK